MKSELKKLISFADYKLAQFGIPDFSHHMSRQPSLRVMRELLPLPLLDAITTCCKHDRFATNGCGNRICPRCSTLMRMGVAINACKFQHCEGLQASFFTCALKNLVAPQGQLSSLDPHEHAEVMREAFAEAGRGFKTPIFAVGGFEVALNEDPANLWLDRTASERKLAHEWQVEDHLVILGVNSREFSLRLKSSLLNGRKPIKAEFKVKPCYCTGRTVIYATKCRPVRRKAGLDDDGNITRKPRDLARKPLREALLWLSSVSPEDRLLTFYNQRIRK